MGHARGREDRAAPAEAPRGDPTVAVRVEAASRAASALAHEFANYLGTMRAMVELLAGRMATDPEATRDLDLLAESAAGAVRFLASLRSFTHPQPLGDGTSDLNAVLREAEPSLRGLVKDGAKLTLRLAPGPLEVRGDVARLRLIAADTVGALASSLPAAGEVVIATDAATGGGCAFLVVRSTGRGIEAENSNRIFEPFAWDRSYDGGLRLPTVYAVVAASGGTADATVRDGEATVRLALPQPASRSGPRGAAA
jgi:signal transduction histidine kinase